MEHRRPSRTGGTRSSNPVSSGAESVSPVAAVASRRKGPTSPGENRKGYVTDVNRRQHPNGTPAEWSSALSPGSDATGVSPRTSRTLPKPWAPSLPSRVLAETVPPRLAATALTLYGTVGVGAAVALLTLVSGSLYAKFGAQGFWVMAALCAAALPLARKL
jgi:hypothetical protein